MDSARLLAFCASFFLISISPGLCMTLAMSLGIGIGVRRTLWMMLGELTGIALVATAAMVGVAALLLRAPLAFDVAKLFGAAYLLWMAVRTWRAPASTLVSGEVRVASSAGLISQGFITAVSNPKAWVFLAALLPPFIAADKPLGPQMAVLLLAMVLIEFGCMLIYASGGRALSRQLASRGLGQWLNRVSACLMAGVAIWLLAGQA